MSSTAEATDDGSRPARASLWLPCLLLVGATAAVYGQTLGFDFLNYDDREYVLENQNVRAGLTWAGLAWAWTTTYQANWHPLTWISLMLDAQIAGVDARMFHLTNVLLHAANALLLFLSLDRMTRKRARSFFVAALFAVHPLHVESVAWVAERKDVLSTLFFFLTLLAYERWVNRPGRGRYALVTLALAAGLLAKPMLVTTPFVLLLLDGWPLGRLGIGKPGTFWRRVREKAPLFALAAASSAVTVFAQRAGGALASFDLYPLPVRIENALVAYVAYLGKTLWPFGLAVPYKHPREALSLGLAVASGVLLAGLTLAVLRAARRRPYLAAGWLWYLGTLVPVIGLVQVGLQAMADRYTYVPLVGIFIMVVWGAPDLLGRRAACGAGAVLVVACAAVAFAQASLWRDSVTLFEHTVKITRNNDTAENNLGSAYYARGMLEQSVTHYAEAVRIQPRYAVALNNLAGALNILGRVDEAIERWNEAILSQPDFTAARANLAGVLYKQGRLEEAIRQCEEALKADPKHAAAHYNLGVIFLKQGKLSDAQDHLAAAVAEAPDEASYLLNLGVALARQERFDEAIERFRQVLRLDPKNELARRNLDRARSLGKAQD